MKKLFFITLLVASSLVGFAQFDTEFWFAPPYANPLNDPNNEFRFVFSTSNLPSTVTITQPANPSFTAVTFTIPANSNYVATITSTFANVCQPNATSNRGFKIMATQKVFCYYEIYTSPTYNIYNTEIFSLKGKNAMGTDFFIPMQNYLANYTYTQQCYSYFSILATQDNTTLTVTPTQAIDGHSANVAFNVTLNTGQFYTAKSTAFSATGHPTGSRVISDKPITITYYDDSMAGVPYGGCADIGGDQIVPVNMLGNLYIPVQGFTFYQNSSGATGPYDPVFIMATQDNTNVSINVGPNIVLNAGQTYKYQFTVNPLINSANSAAFISSNNPIYVSQISGFGCEVGYSILPSIECRGSRSVSITRSQGDSYYITLMTKQAYTSGFTFNGSTTVITTSDFLDVPGLGGTYKFARKLLSTSSFPIGSTARIENSLGDFHMGVINGGDGNTCKFGYFSDFAQYEVSSNLVTNDTICEGDSIKFIIVNPYQSGLYTWTQIETETILQGPSSLTYMNYPNASPSNTGTYLVEGSVGFCTMKSDTLNLVVLEKPNPEFTFEVNCIHNPTIFHNETENGHTYHWEFGDGENSDQFEPSHVYENAGPYDVKLFAYNEFGCFDTIVHSLEIAPGIEVYDTTSLCPKGSYEFYDQTLTIAGNYQHFIDSQECDTTIYLTLNQIEASVYIVQEPFDFCEYQQAMLIATSEFPNFIWSTGESTPQIFVNSSGLYTVTATLNDCHVSTSIKILPCEQFIYLPNTITPGELDGLNDYFALSPSLVPSVEEFEIYIFDRWGNRVFYSYDPAFKWDGRVGGMIQPNNIYSYKIMIRIVDTKPLLLTGSITVL
jgi:gliding motility-associated-like protein